MSHMASSMTDTDRASSSSSSMRTWIQQGRVREQTYIMPDHRMYGPHG